MCNTVTVAVRHTLKQTKFFFSRRTLIHTKCFVSLCLLGWGMKVETILKDDETLTPFLLRDVPLTEFVVNQLVNAHIRPEQVHTCTHTHYNCEGCNFSILTSINQHHLIHFETALFM